jgi:hypothetical protein
MGPGPSFPTVSRKLLNQTLCSVYRPRNIWTDERRRSNNEGNKLMYAKLLFIQSYHDSYQNILLQLFFYSLLCIESAIET